MDKPVRIVLAAIAAIAVGSFIVLGSGASDDAVAKWQQRLTAARKGGSVDRLIEGRVVQTGETIRSPLWDADVVAFAKWTQVRIADSRVFRAEHLALSATTFEVQTSDETFVVDGRLVGLSDLVHRVHGPQGDVEASIAPGDRIALMGEVSERHGRPGFYGEYIVVKGTFDEWYAAVPRGTLPSIPAQP